jgi:hypothetical protein
MRFGHELHTPLQSLDVDERRSHGRFDELDVVGATGRKLRKDEVVHLEAPSDGGVSLRTARRHFDPDQPVLPPRRRDRRFRTDAVCVVRVRLVEARAITDRAVDLLSAFRIAAGEELDLERLRSLLASRASPLLYRLRQSSALLLGESTGKRRRLAQFPRARAVGADRPCDPGQRQRQNSFPLVGPARIDATLCAPAPETPARVLDESLVETLRDESVIGKSLKLGRAVAPTSARRKELVDVNLLGGATASLAHHRCQRPTLALSPPFFDLFEQLEELRKRDFATTLRRRDRGDLAVVDPAV